MYIGLGNGPLTANHLAGAAVKFCEALRLRLRFSFGFLLFLFGFGYVLLVMVHIAFLTLSLNYSECHAGTHKEGEQIFTRNQNCARKNEDESRLSLMRSRV